MSQSLPSAPLSIQTGSKNEHEKKAQKPAPHRTDAQAHYGQGKKLIGHGKSWMVRGRLLRG